MTAPARQLELPIGLVLEVDDYIVPPRMSDDDYPKWGRHHPLLRARPGRRRGAVTGGVGPAAAGRPASRQDFYKQKR